MYLYHKSPTPVHYLESKRGRDCLLNVGSTHGTTSFVHRQLCAQILLLAVQTICRLSPVTTDSASPLHLVSSGESGGGVLVKIVLMILNSTDRKQVPPPNPPPLYTTWNQSVGGIVYSNSQSVLSICPDSLVQCRIDTQNY